MHELHGLRTPMTDVLVLCAPNGWRFNEDSEGQEQRGSDDGHTVKWFTDGSRLRGALPRSHSCTAEVMSLLDVASAVGTANYRSEWEALWGPHDHGGAILATIRTILPALWVIGHVPRDAGQRS
jgi:hypothetical protein